MAFVNVVGIVRTTCIREVEEALHRIGAPGISFSRVKGYGDYENFFRADLTDEHFRVEVFVPEERGEEVARTVMEAACSGSTGDGLVAIQPVARLFKVRKGDEATTEDL